MSTPIPRLPERLKKHYLLLAPLETHWRPATCEEVACDRWVNGWELVIPAGPRAQDRIDYVRADRARAKKEYRRPDGTVVFRFPPCTPLYAGNPEHDNHRIRIDRPELFGVLDRKRDPGIRWHGGRGNGADDWVDDFANHQDTLSEAHKRG